jgi:protein phosphatase 2C family protein 2/3
MVKACLPLAAAALVLLLMVATAQGIRLDAGSQAALSNKVLNVSDFYSHLLWCFCLDRVTNSCALFDRLQKSVDKGVVIKADGEASSDELGETISEEKNRHGMPDIHVDYYGPRGHNPRHH